MSMHRTSPAPRPPPARTSPGTCAICCTNCRLARSAFVAMYCSAFRTTSSQVLAGSRGSPAPAPALAAVVQERRLAAGSASPDSSLARRALALPACGAGAREDSRADALRKTRECPSRCWAAPDHGGGGVGSTHRAMARWARLGALGRAGGGGGREVLEGGTGGGGVWDPKACVPKMPRQDFPNCKFRSSPLQSLWSGGGGPGGGGGALTRKRHIPPHSAQPRHTNYWAPRTRKRHEHEHRPQRPTERSDPTQHAKGRTGDRPGPHKETTTRRNVTQGGTPPPPAVYGRSNTSLGGRGVRHYGVAAPGEGRLA